jgi:phosphate transport system substrate-binding protein
VRKYLFCGALALTLSFVAQAQMLINGAGATFPAPIYTKWFSDYASVDTSIHINYQPQGSGAGINQVTSGTVDFGATDGPMTDEEISKGKIKVLHFPTVMGAVVATYNIPGVTVQLNFTQEALVGIFLGKITKWNDPAIASANKGVKLPNESITVAHRADSSGTSFVFTDFLSTASPEWASPKGPGRGKSVNWPVGLASKGNDGVTGLVKQQPNSIGYVDQIFAVTNKLLFGKIQNKAGQFIQPSSDSVAAAAASTAKAMPADFRISIVNAPGKDAYPISTFTWLLIPAQIQDATKKKALVGFLNWMLTKGQDSVESLDYVRLPKEVVAKEQKAISLIH